MDKEILFYALKRLEQEIQEERNKGNLEMVEILETKYSYWKQLMANPER